MPNLNERLKAARERRGFGLRRAALDLGVPFATYQGYENGRRPIPLTFLDRLRDKWGLEAEVLIEEQPTARSSDPDADDPLLTTQERLLITLKAALPTLSERDADVLRHTIEAMTRPRG